MIPLGPSHRFCLYREPADMRKSFDGFCGLVRSGLKTGTRSWGRYSYSSIGGERTSTAGWKMPSVPSLWDARTTYLRVRILRPSARQ